MSNDDQPDPRMALPMVYVPAGYVPLKEAVIRLADFRKPELPIRLYLETGPVSVVDPLRTLPGETDRYASQAPTHEAWRKHLSDRDKVYSWVALGYARDELRRALAEGDLVAQGQEPDGKLVPVLQGYWRTDDGAYRLRFTDRVDLYTQVFFLEEPLRRWLGNLPKVTEDEVMVGGTTKGEHAATQWLKEQLSQPESELIAKPQFLIRAREAFEGLSVRGFNRVWKSVHQADGTRTNFRKAGRKPGRKS